MCCYSQHPEIHWIFQGYFTVQLSRFFVLLSFSATACSFYLIKPVLSRTFLFYFILSKAFSFEQLVYINSSLSLCQELFELIIQASGEGGIWTLAPLLTTCTLSRGVPSTSWVLLQIVDSDNLYNDRRHECLAERVGFEPTRPCGQTVFKTASLWPLRYLSSNVLYYVTKSFRFCQELF